jgi:Amt family ammonium transporter
MLVVASLGMAAPQCLLLALLVTKAPAANLSAFALAGCTAASVLALLIIALTLTSHGRAAVALHSLVQAFGSGEDAPPATDDSIDIVADVQRLTEQFEAVRSGLSKRHPGTGLQTREPFLSEIAADMVEANEPALLAVIRFCDFDRLAPFDQDGAERALNGLGARLRGAIERGRRLAQVDRDCFAVWFRGVTMRDATRELRAITYVLGQDLGAGERRFTPELKVGAAVFPHDGDDAAILLTRAFAALPKPGDPKEDNLAFFSATSSVAARERFGMEQDLRHAISRDQLKVYFQPVVDLSLGRVVGAEALARWLHPDQGSVPPSEFIPVLEQSGLIDEVGLWVLNAACREARGWRDRGLEGLTVAVNLSARQFRDPVLSMMILRTLERHRLLAQNLELELTETAMMQDAVRTRQLLLHLKALGVGVAIDDFGTGYSSLSCLKSLPFTKMKIDREFVTNVHERPDSKAICSTIIALARGLDMKIVAEGVESAEEVETLREMGCSLFQGYYFARALPAATFLETITDPSWLARLETASAKPSRAVLRRA